MWNKIKMFNFRKNWKWFLIPGAILILIPTITVAIYQIRSAKNARNNTFNDKFKVPDESIFPELDVNDYYQFIEYVNHQLVVGDKLVAAVISDIAARLNISYGNLNFSYEKINNQKINFYVDWIGKDNHKISKNFSLELY